MDCVIGIDGGGTRSTGLCLGLDGRHLARAEGGALNYHAGNVEDFRAHLRELMDELLKALPVARVRRAVIGTASLFDYATAEETARACHGISDPETTCLLGDALTALYGAASGRPGLLVISGTGSIAVALGHDQRFHTAGGYGPLIGGDPGSAFWIASQAVLAAARRSPVDALPLAICGYFQVENLQDVVQLVYGQKDGCRRLAGLAGFLSSHASVRSGEFASIQLKAGEELAQIAATLFVADLAEAPHIYISGSVLRNNAVVRRGLEAGLHQRLGRPITLESPQLSAAAGAALLALEQAGAPITPDLTRTLQSILP